jgi:hypothetical protein
MSTFTAELLESRDKQSVRMKHGAKLPNISGKPFPLPLHPLSPMPKWSSGIVALQNSKTRSPVPVGICGIEFETSVPKTSAGIIEFWTRIHGGKAVLILDGVSLRETPWLLQQAANVDTRFMLPVLVRTELPCETSPFAKALGFAQRSALENNGAGGAHKLT